MSASRQRVLRAREALLNGSGKLSYFRERGISKEAVQRSYVGYETGVFLYPCIGMSGGLLGVHFKSEGRDGKGKRRQWWGGYAGDLPKKKDGKPAKVIPFGLVTLKDLEPGSLSVLCCGEEDARSLRQAGYAAVSQPGAGRSIVLTERTFNDHPEEKLKAERIGDTAQRRRSG